MRGEDRDSGRGFESDWWNTSSGGTFSPNVRTTRAILRLRSSVRLSSIGEVGVGGTSKEAERGERTAAATRGSEDAGCVELRRMTGRSLLPGCLDRTASIKGAADSSVEESDVLSSDSLEEE